MDNKKYTNLESLANLIKTDDGTANTVGVMLAEILQCTRDKKRKDRWKTTQGSKTNIGLARTVLSILEINGRKL